MKEPIIGIDFGTTNTAVAVINDSQRPTLISIDAQADNPYILRSVIYFSLNHNCLFGSEAIAQYNYDVAHQKAAQKRIIRTGNFIKIASDPSAKSGFKPDKIVAEVYEAEVTNSGRLLQGIKNLLGRESLSSIGIFKEQYKVEEIVAIFLGELRQRISQSLGQEVKQAVIGRPVTFVGSSDELAVWQLITAAKIAGFTNIQLQLEPIGAAYDFQTDNDQEQQVLVFDFGGGTLDLSIVSFPSEEIITSQGMPLGGDLINSHIFLQEIASFFGRGEKFGLKQLSMPESIYHRLGNWFSISMLKSKSFANSLENFTYKNTNPQCLKNLEALVFNNLGFQLYEEIDRVKQALSSKRQEELYFPMPGSEINKNILRSRFEKIIANDLLKIDQLISQTLTTASVSESEIDLVAMTGGSSLIPAVQDLLKLRFGQEKLKSRDNFTSVASGLAVYAQILRRNSV